MNETTNQEKQEDMKVEYERNLQQTRLILEFHEIYEEDYQIRMLRSNTPKRLLMVHGQGKEETTRYYYNISGKKAMKDCFDESHITSSEIEKFMKQFLEVLEEVQKLLLNPDCLLLSPEFVYCEEGQYYFCFCPCKKGTIWAEFHKLTEYFVKKTDYENKEGIYLAYELHKASMEENYNIEAVLEEILEKKEAELERLYKKKENDYDLEEDIWLGDWVGEQELVGSGFREKTTFWGKLGEKMRRKKKNDWGEWDESEE